MGNVNGVVLERFLFMFVKYVLFEWIYIRVGWGFLVMVVLVL